jgi:hypothetical protein
MQRCYRTQIGVDVQWAGVDAIEASKQCMAEPHAAATAGNIDAAAVAARLRLSVRGPRV